MRSCWTPIGRLPRWRIGERPPVLPADIEEIKYSRWTKTNNRAMEKTHMEFTTPGSRADTLENPPSPEAGPMDSVGGQPLLEKNYSQNTDIKPTS